MTEPFVPHALAAAGISHLLRLNYYVGDVCDSWEYLISDNNIFLDVYARDPDEGYTYGAYYSIDRVYRKQELKHPDFLAARDLGVLFSSLALTGTKEDSTERSVLLLVLSHVLNYALYTGNNR